MITTISLVHSHHLIQIQKVKERKLCFSLLRELLDLLSWQLSNILRSMVSCHLHIVLYTPSLGLSWWLSAKEFTNRSCGFHPSIGNIPWRRKWQPTPVFLPGKSHGQRSLEDYSPWGQKRVGHDLATKWQIITRSLYLLTTFIQFPIVCLWWPQIWCPFLKKIFFWSPFLWVLGKMSYFLNFYIQIFLPINNVSTVPPSSSLGNLPFYSLFLYILFF